MKKFLFAFIFIVFLVGCSNKDINNDDFVIIKGAKSNIQELNDNYSLLDDDRFIILIYQDSSNLYSPFYMVNSIETNENLIGNYIYLYDYDNNNIKTIDSTIAESDLVYGDVLIAQTKENAVNTTNPISASVEQIYYLGYSLSNTITLNESI